MGFAIGQRNYIPQFLCILTQPFHLSLHAACVGLTATHGFTPIKMDVGLSCTLFPGLLKHSGHPELSCGCDISAVRPREAWVQDQQGFISAARFESYVCLKTWVYARILDPTFLFSFSLNPSARLFLCLTTTDFE